MPRLLHKDWISSFLDLNDETEIPRDYLIWSAISIISSVIGLKCYVNYRNNPKYYANQYIILIGPPGIGKNEAIDKATELGEKSGCVNIIKDWNTPEQVIETLKDGFFKTSFLPGQIGQIGQTGVATRTPQTITGNLFQEHTATIIAPELSVFLQKYDSLHAIMCEWWNRTGREFSYKTKNKGKYSIPDICVNLLGGCVPDYIRSLSKDQLAPITGGFTARTIFVQANKKHQLISGGFGSRLPINLTKRKLRQDLEDKLVNDLKHIASITGELYLDSKAEELWERKYQEHNDPNTRSYNCDASANFKSRISSHIAKVAIAVSVGTSDAKCITRDHLERAIRLIEGVRDKIDIIFRGVGESSLAFTQNKTLEIIEQRGMITYNDLWKIMYRDCTDSEFVTILKILTSTGGVHEDILSNSKVVYYSKAFYARMILARKYGGQGVVIP